jgi:hypothetical protein
MPAEMNREWSQGDWSSQQDITSETMGDNSSYLLVTGVGDSQSELEDRADEPQKPNEIGYGKETQELFAKLAKIKGIALMNPNLSKNSTHGSYSSYGTTSINDTIGTVETPEEEGDEAKVKPAANQNKPAHTETAHNRGTDPEAAAAALTDSQASTCYTADPPLQRTSLRKLMKKSLSLSKMIPSNTGKDCEEKKEESSSEEESSEEETAILEEFFHGNRAGKREEGTAEEEECAGALSVTATGTAPAKGKESDIATKDSDYLAGSTGASGAHVQGAVRGAESKLHEVNTQDVLSFLKNPRKESSSSSEEESGCEKEVAEEEVDTTPAVNDNSGVKHPDTSNELDSSEDELDNSNNPWEPNGNHPITKLIKDNCDQAKLDQLFEGLSKKNRGYYPKGRGGSEGKGRSQNHYRNHNDRQW